MKSTYHSIVQHLLKLRDLPLLLIRLTLAYGFYSPAIAKVNDIGAIAEWFETLGMPAPLLNAYLATYTEVAGVILLALGLATRFITVPLIITMIVAVKTVHWQNGFNASDNGFEIPLYYTVMLITLMIYGAGKISLDGILRRRLSRK